jgi:hypothetical protein
MSTSTEQDSSWPELRTGPIITGAALIGGGSLIVLAGLAVAGSHLLLATRRWVQQMDVPPREQARIKWSQARSAAAAGAAAWQNGASRPGART